MLPFLKPKTGSGSSLVIQKRDPNGSFNTPDDQPEGNQAMESCAVDILRAIEQKDTKKLAEALQAAFQICDSEPHEEGPHINESDEE